MCVKCTCGIAFKVSNIGVVKADKSIMCSKGYHIISTWLSLLPFENGVIEVLFQTLSSLKMDFEDLVITSQECLKLTREAHWQGNARPLGMRTNQFN